MELPFLFEPKHDESPLGYYRRLSGANALKSWKELATMAEVSPSSTGLLGRPEHVAEMLKIPAHWAQELTLREQELSTLRSLHNSRRDAICPQCIGEDPYLRFFWGHAYVTACLKHRICLVDHCPACSESLDINRERIEFCSCGQELSHLRGAPASPAQLWLSGLLSSAGADSAALQPQVVGVSVGDLTQLVRTLCLWFDVHGAAPRRNAAAPRSVGEAMEFLAPLELLLADWPRGYEEHVSARIAAGPAQARTIKALLGHWYQKVLSLSAKGPLKAFLLPVLRIAADEFDGAIAVDDGARVEDLRYLRLSDAAHAYRIKLAELRRAVAKEQVNYRAARYGTKGKVFQVLRTDVERIVKSRAGWISEDEACKRLGLPPKVLSNLAGAGLIEADFEWRGDVFKGGAVRMGAVEALEETLRAHQADDPATDELIAFRELTSRRLGDNTAIQSLMRAIQSGDVRAQGNAEVVGSLQYRLSEVRRFFGTPLLEAGLSVHQLSKLTGWKHESIDHWMELGLLQSYSIVLRGQPCRVVVPAQLLSFTRTYMPLADLAKSVGRTSRLLNKQLTQIEIIAGKVLPGGGQRGALVRMSDLACLAVNPKKRMPGAS